MAEVMRIANYAQTSTVDLLGGTLQLERQSWATRAAGPNIGYGSGSFGGPGAFTGYGNVAETFSLIGSGTVSALTAAVVALDEIAADVRRSQSGKRYTDTWWFEWNADGEGAKRALIHALTLSYPTGPGYSPLIENGKIRVDVALTRHPLWESTAGASITVEEVSTAGGTVTIGAIPGTEMARIQKTDFLPTGASELSEYWLGIRPLNAGVANFSPVVEVAADEANCFDVSDVADLSASGESAIRVTFATRTDLARRADADGADFVTNDDYDALTGSYLVMVRCRVTSGATVGIQLSAGMGGGQIDHDEIIIENDSWMYVPLGLVDIPPWADRSVELLLGDISRYFSMYILAERISTTATHYLYLDQVVLVPSEHMVYVHGSKNYYETAVFTLADERCFVVKGVADTADLATTDWYLPPEGGKAVLVAQAYDGHLLSETCDVSLTWFPRWLSYRHDAAST